MTRPILPSQIINYLDAQYPQAKGQQEENGGQFYLERAHGPKVRQILSMIENIPQKLLNFDDDSHTEFYETIAAIQCAVDAWNAGDKQYKLEKIPGRQKMHPFTILRKHLLKLKDEESSNRSGKEEILDIDKVTPGSRKVFVVHGRDDQLRRDFFSFLRALGLQPIEWSDALKLTGKATPYIGETIDSAFKKAQAVIVLLSPDDEVRLSPMLWKDKDEEDEKNIRLQARPNVLFEAGMAFGTYPDRTLLVEVGEVKKFSDVAGRHVVRLTNSPDKRNEITERLRTAGCDVSSSGNDWLNAGNFDVSREAKNVSDYMDLKELQEISNAKDSMIFSDMAPDLSYDEVQNDYEKLKKMAMTGDLEDIQRFTRFLELKYFPFLMEYSKREKINYVEFWDNIFQKDGALSQIEANLKTEHDIIFLKEFKQSMMFSRLVPVQSYEQYQIEYERLEKLAIEGDMEAFNRFMDFLRNNYFPFMKAYMGGKNNNYIALWNKIFGENGTISRIEENLKS